MAEINTYQDIIAWQKSHELVLMVYEVTRNLPDTEKFALLTQMRKCAVSVPANIAEGFARSTAKESVRFYNISLASLAELDYYFLICNDLTYITEEKYNELKAFGHRVGGLIYRWSESQLNNSNNN